jgi:hypothetical protein
MAAVRDNILSIVGALPGGGWTEDEISIQESTHEH